MVGEDGSNGFKICLVKLLASCFKSPWLLEENKAKRNLNLFSSTLQVDRAIFGNILAKTLLLQSTRRLKMILSLKYDDKR